MPSIKNNPKHVTGQTSAERIAALELDKQRLVNRGHWVGAAIGVVGTITVALTGLLLNHKEPPQLPPKQEPLTTAVQAVGAISGTSSKSLAMPSGQDVIFLLQHLYSSALYHRKEKVFVAAWDERCKNLATATLLKLNYKIFSLQDDRAVRGEADGLTLGVQCFSGWDHALIYGVSLKDQYPLLQDAGRILVEQMKLQMKEFEE